MLDFKVECPHCHFQIHIPFVPALKAKAVEDYDLAELSAQQELFSLQRWLASASLWSLLKFWLRRERNV